MQTNITLSPDNNSLQISGTLSFENARAVCEQGLKLLPQAQQAVFDFAAVERCDSAALALLTAWARAAKTAGKEARFTNLPSQLFDIACLSNLDKVLVLEANA
jgi:phospholipid transport system transporter-binding protein